MSASSAASSTLSRSRATVLGITVLAAAYGSYYLYRSSSSQAQTSPSTTSLHRSNAVHRQRRRSTPMREEPASSLFVDGFGENNSDEQAASRTLNDAETVVDDSVFQDDYSWNDAPPSYQRSGQNIVQLLFRVSEDATRRNAYVHRGCACNGCGVVPIRGIRYRCANCSDYDLCEGCESQGIHIKTHIFYKIRVPTPSFGPRHLQPVWYTGDPDSMMKVLPKEMLLKLSRETGFERPELDAYWEQWTFMANTDWRDDPDDINLAMDRRTFERCLVPSGGYRHPAPSLIFDRMFAFYDANKDDLIGFPEFLHGLAYRKKRDKWTKIFEGYDIDGDGFVDRKDFLRMFRSYYVLYRQMHRDMLEGMDEQQMSTTDAHRLVSSRQPLSSAFGQDGRYPPAPDPRTGEGKTILPNGDLEITDGKGVMNESGDDTGDREDVFKRPLPGRLLWGNRGDRNTNAYWDAIINPPVSVEQIPEVLTNLTRHRRLRSSRRQRAEFIGIFTNSHPVPGPAGEENEENEVSSSDSDEDIATDDDPWPPRFVNVTDEDAEAIGGPGARVADVPRESRAVVLAHAVERERAQRTIYERWKRRQFYTDEEEGATPPADWKEDDDILAQSGMVGESSSSQPRPSYHSRSSSRVRFAEDMDDFDTRSNPSTSSRSVPERWGGMEIPDAEKDAGKEILYQVTQQAFNELLDPLFKAKENQALDAAETKSDRERYRHLYSSPEFQEWATEKETEELKGLENASKSPPPPPPPPGSRQPVWPSFPEVEVEEVRERPLEELLAATGYSVETSQADVSQTVTHTTDSDAIETTQVEEISHQAAPPTALLTDTSLNGNFSINAQFDNDRESSPSSHHSTPPQATPPSPSSVTETHRDPTLPQFRSDTLPPFQSIPTPAPGRMPRFQEHITSPPPSPYPPTFNMSTKPTRQNPITYSKDRKGNTILSFSHNEADLVASDKEYLLKLWRCDRAEREKEARGGWGKLGFEEFETIVKRLKREERGNQMDYLGSWIEFCIP